MRMVRTFEVKKLTSEVSKVFDVTFRENGLIKTKFTFCLTVSAESTKILTGIKTAAIAISGCFWKMRLLELLLDKTAIMTQTYLTFTQQRQMRKPNWLKSIRLASTFICAVICRVATKRLFNFLIQLGATLRAQSQTSVHSWTSLWWSTHERFLTTQ